MDLDATSPPRTAAAALLRRLIFSASIASIVEMMMLEWIEMFHGEKDSETRT